MPSRNKLNALAAYDLGICEASVGEYTMMALFSWRDDITATSSMQDVGRKLLQSIGLYEPSDEQIEAAIDANNVFIAKLEAIRDTALQFEEELTNGHADTIGTS